MERQHCGSSHNRKNDKAEVNKITFAVIVTANSSIAMNHPIETFVGSKNKIWLWTAVDVSW
jgi:hypothetical protein